MNVNISEDDEKEASDKMNEGIQSFKAFKLNRKNKIVIGCDNKSTSGKINDEVFLNRSFEAIDSCVNTNDVNNKLPTDCMDEEIDSIEKFKEGKNSESDSDAMSEMDVVENITDTELNCMKNSLLDCVARSDGFFKSQQVGESDLTFIEKREIASDLLTKSLPLFLQRYWKFIKIDDVPYFDAERSNYEVNFYVNEIIKLNNTKINKVRIKNRRYEALQRMVDEGSYFSDAEMKKRNPFLFDQMIGQHLTEKERIAAYKEQYPDKNFSAFLLNQMDKNVENCLYEKQKNEDEAIVEEEDDDTEEDECELEDDEPVKKFVSNEEKKQLRSEFTNIMYENFLDGKDMDFDYSSVDNNADFDSIHQRDIDEQEKYFDEESSHSSS